MSKLLLRIGGVKMAQRQSIAGMPVDDFDRAACQIVRKVAVGIRMGIQTAAKHGGVQVHSKPGYTGTAGSSIVTNLDTGAQKHFMQLVKEYGLPPGIGYVGEEKNLRIMPKSEDIVVTIDPLDGTSTLVELLRRGRRLPPLNASVMMGLQVDGVAVASYICDLATLDVYVRGAFSRDIVVLHQDGRVEDLSNRSHHQHALSRTGLLRHGARRPVSGWVFDKLMTSFGCMVPGAESFGLCIIGVADGTYGALLRPGGGNWTPWDDVPVNALCQMGEGRGLAIFQLGVNGLREIQPPQLTGITHFENDLLYIERRSVPDLMSSSLPVRRL